MSLLFRILLLAPLLYPCAAGPATSSPSTVVDLGYAKYRGEYNDSINIVHYYSIPFAVPPVGNLRWRPPVAIEQSLTYGAKTTIIDATQAGPRCVQGTPTWSSVLAGAGSLVGSNGTVDPPESEDCLTLDVVVPVVPRSKKLPVLVLIHGGGYTTGDLRETDPEQLIYYANGNVLAVNIQYRLGVYGFLGSKEITSDGTANVGLLDQRAALEWVQRNIASFGGDSDAVTIWGGSAGGGSVQLQMMLYGGSDKPPFRAGISEYPGQLPYPTDDVLEAQYRDLLSASKCTTLQCLRSLPYDDLKNATQGVYDLGYEDGRYGYGNYYVTPTLDGKIVKELPSDAFRLGHFSKVPLLTDRNWFEGELFTDPNITHSPTDVLAFLSKLWRTSDQTVLSKVLSLYPLSNYNATYFADPILIELALLLFPNTLNNAAFAQTADILGDAAIKCQSWNGAMGTSHAGLPTWKLVADFGIKLHGAAGLVAFGTASPTDVLGSTIKDYYLAFAVNLDPNKSVPGVLYPVPWKPNWPQYLAMGQGGRQVLQVRDTTAFTTTDPDDSEKCRFYADMNQVFRT